LNIVPLLAMPSDEVQFYFQTLAMHGLLKYRLSDYDDPQWEDVKDVIRRMGNHMYVLTTDKRILAEFTLENFTGRAAQIHFSMHPGNTAFQNLKLCRYGLKTILSTWRQEDDELEPYLDSLYGLTPIHNRVACLFVLRAGFKKLGTLKSACQYCGHICDGMITSFTREDISYG